MSPEEEGLMAINVPRLPMTAQEFERMRPVKGLRIELWEGNLDVAAAAQMNWHANTAWEIIHTFRAAGRFAVSEVGVVVADRTVRAPDVMRYRPGVRPAGRVSQVQPADVDLVVEVVSPESERRDRVIKPEEYAAAGIPEYWLVEQHPDDDYDAVINVHLLSPDGRYVLDRTVDLSALLGEKRG
jgi:Uma2 family endonuclease